MRKIMVEYTKNKTQSKGMTMMELIVVLSIFSIMSSITLFSYKNFQDKVELKNLVNQMATKIVEAQKNATNGRLSPPLPWTQPVSTWKPSYGLYYNSLQANTKFITIVDLDNSGTNPLVLPGFPTVCNNYPSGTDCNPPTYGLGSKEVTDIVQITKATYSLAITKGTGSCSVTPPGNPISINDLSIVFVRPDSGATLINTTYPYPGCNVISAQITVTSSYGVKGYIIIDSSGRIQIK